MTRGNSLYNPSFTGTVKAGSNNTVDIGESGTAFRTGYFATRISTPEIVGPSSTVTVDSNLIMASSSRLLFWASSTLMAAPSNGVLKITTNNQATAAFIQAAGVQGGTQKTLTAAAATGVLDVAVASNARISGVLQIAVEADDGTEFQVRHLWVPFTAVNKAGTVTSTLGTPVETVTVSAGTLTCTITITDGAGKITLNANAASSLTETTLRAQSVIISPHTLTITAL